MGDKETWLAGNIVIDGADADALKDGEIATFINWGNLKIKSVVR